MPSTTRTDGPRHMAGRPHRPAGPPARAGSPAMVESVELGVAEVPVAARVPRSRLFFALAITAAALPILVLDNLPATAGTTAKASIDASGEGLASEAPATSTTALVAAVAPPTTTVVVPVTAAGPATTVAPPVTEAPATTGPPATVRTLTASRPSPSPSTTQPPAPAPERTDPNDPATWDRLARCEAGGNWSTNTGNGYYGGLQFTKGTWDRLGGGAFAEYPHQATQAQQIEIGQRLYAQSGWDAWPGCRDELGFH